MASKTQIGNIMLARIGSAKQVANVETEQRVEARTIRLFFEDDRKFVLRGFPWPFATSYATLNLVSGSSTSPVNYDWIYAYRMPSDCLYVRRIVTVNGRKETNPPPFRVGRDEQGKLIYTNETDAQIEYTADVDDPEEFDPLFVSAFAWKIGAGCAPSLSRVKDMAETCMQMYLVDLSHAQSRALNEGQQEAPIEAEIIRARD